MRAFTLDGFDAAPALRDDLPEPDLGEAELLVRANASSVNPVDVFVAGGGLKEMAEHEFPVILGRDFAGVVERVGSGVSRYGVGDEVFGFLPPVNPTVHHGSWVELITVPEDNFVAAKPQSVDSPRPGLPRWRRSLRSPPSMRSAPTTARRCWSSAPWAESAASSCS